jgi:succinyl-diaminopimelate desuccinylase
MIEVAEKSILWLKITVHGRQCHASMPQDGVNAARAAAALTLRLEELYSRFPDEAADFVPPRSTFEPTRREANVPNVNTLPGQDVFYLDCRILPHYAVAAVRAAVREAADAVAAERGVTIDVEDEMCLEAGPATPAEAPVVRALQAAVREVYGVAAVPMGIGGGTVAACFRRRGLPAAVWCTIDQMAHQPNESCRVSNLVNDAKVFAHLALQPPEA